MKAQLDMNVERTGLSLRIDIKAAMEKLRERRSREDGGYVSLGVVFGEAALLLLEQEGIELPSEPAPRKPVKSVRRRRAA